MSDKTLSGSRREARSHSRDSKVIRIHTEKNGAGLKTAIFALLIMLQVAVLLTLYFRYIAVAMWYIILSLVLSIICSIHVLSTEKEGHTKAIWVLFLMIGFTIGFIAYILSSEKLFFGNSSRRYKKIFACSEKYTPDYVSSAQVSPAVGRDVEFLKTAGNFPAFSDSEVKYFSSGTQLFDDVLETLKTAEKFIFMEFFIVADGVLLRRVCKILYEKIKAGVDVRLIIDGLGSHGPLAIKTIRAMRKAGVKIYKFNRLMLMFSFALNLRDHRKIIISDGKTAYAGGCNLADEYVNEKRLHGYWKDTGVRVRGRAVDGFTLMFLRQWEFVSKKTEDYAPYLGLYEAAESCSTVVPYAAGKDYKHNIVRGLYTSIMSGAQEKLYIMTPYFVPDADTMNLLKTKALSGVDVRLILPDIPDKSYVYMVSLGNARKLTECGVKVMLMKQSFVHSKVVYSENCVSVGSANIDLRSYYNQFENGLYTDDKDFLLAVERDFEETCAVSKDMRRRVIRYPLWNRIITGFLRLFSPLM